MDTCMAIMAYMVPWDIEVRSTDCDERSADRLITVALDETDDMYRQDPTTASETHHTRTQTDLSEDLVLTGMY